MAIDNHYHDAYKGKMVDFFKKMQNNEAVKQLGGNADDGVVSKDELAKFVEDLKGKTSDGDKADFSLASQLQREFGEIDKFGAEKLGGKEGDNLISSNEASERAQPAKVELPSAPPPGTLTRGTNLPPGRD